MISAEFKATVPNLQFIFTARIYMNQSELFHEGIQKKIKFVQIGTYSPTIILNLIYKLHSLHAHKM